MQRYEREKTSIEVEVLDLTELKKKGVQFLEQQGKKNVADVDFEKWGRVLTPKGPYLICTEGVGSGPLSADEEFEVAGYHVTTDGGMAFMPSVSFTFTGKELADWPVTDETVRLDEFIRTFGDRLERNYSINLRAILNAMEMGK